jgi:uncharacterized protein
MKKLLLLTVLGLAFLTPSVFAQNGVENAPKVVSTKVHKIVFQLTSNDTLVHKALLKQVVNALNAAPNAKIEIVCHNNGIEMLTISKTKTAKNIVDLKAKGVVFAACENTIRERKIDKADIVSEAIFVPSGIIEIVLKQEDGWSYFKAGF